MLALGPQRLASGAGGGGPVIPSWFFNAKKSQFSTHWLPAVAAMQAGTRNAKLASVGDSITRGKDAVISPQTNQQRNSMPSQLSVKLTAAGFPAGSENQMALGGLSTPTDLSDDRFVTTGTLSTSGATPPGGSLWVLDSAGDKLTFTPDFAFDTVDIYWTPPGVVTSTLIDVDFGGAVLASPNVAGTTSDLRKSTVTGPLGIHPVNIAWSAGTPRIAGIDCYNSAQKQISCWNFGATGSYTGQWTINALPRDRLRGVMEGYGPDLVSLNLGVNDWRISQVSVATYTANMQILIDAARTTYTNKADLVLETPCWDSSSTGLAANQAAYMQAMRDLAISNDLPLVDTAVVWQSWAISNALGRYSDPVHNSVVGHGERATRMAQALTLFIP